jgi:hypothetical protein
VTSRSLLASLQDAFDLGQIPGLKPVKKPWAEFYCPFRADDTIVPDNPSGRVAAGGRFPGLKLRAESSQPLQLQGEEPCMAFI